MLAINNISIYFISIAQDTKLEKLFRAYSPLEKIHSSNRLPRWWRGKESACQCRSYKTCRFSPWIGKTLWVGNGNPLYYSCLEKFHEQRSLVNRHNWVTEHTHRAPTWPMCWSWQLPCTPPRPININAFLILLRFLHLVPGNPPSSLCSGLTAWAGIFLYRCSPVFRQRKKKEV